MNCRPTVNAAPNHSAPPQESESNLRAHPQLPRNNERVQYGLSMVEPSLKDLLNTAARRGVASSAFSYRPLLDQEEPCQRPLAPTTAPGAMRARRYPQQPRLATRRRPLSDVLDEALRTLSF
ncbi:expressed unknown protein [Seminavis robusta]|uniref:Uncharacterized protein n=1 Tax=Seminavis robusta TaxID=568900 RepID=A0A9N8HIR2_9STRA|nr:expressed unknown protein [Seminavis robusta]|eukprot:Sro802_g204691.1  (122) ;mRNA; f:34678-35043